MATKKPYQRFTYDEELELGAADAMLQAAQALDTAADLAVESQDKDTLLAVAAGWLNFSQVLQNLAASPEEEEEAQEEPDIELGFRVPSTGSISIESEEQ